MHVCTHFDIWPSIVPSDIEENYWHKYSYQYQLVIGPLLLYKALSISVSLPHLRENLWSSGLNSLVLLIIVRLQLYVGNVLFFDIIIMFITKLKLINMHRMPHWSSQHYYYLLNKTLLSISHSEQNTIDWSICCTHTQLVTIFKKVPAKGIYWQWKRLPYCMKLWKMVVRLHILDK